MRLSPRILVPILGVLLLSGCGYTWSDNGGGFGASATPPSGNLYRADVHTVAVPVFTNQTYYRGIEFNLSKAVINQLEARTPYKVVPKEQADTILEGRIMFVHVQTINRYAFNALPQEQLYVISVNFTWKDLRTGRILIDRHAFQQTAPYYPVLGEDTFVGSQDTIEKLAVAIVEELQAPWGKTTTKP